MDQGIILLLGVVISGTIIAIIGVVEMLSQLFKVKGPKGWGNFVAGMIVGLLGLLGIWAWG